jgi:hypothetical protein
MASPHAIIVQPIGPAPSSATGSQTEGKHHPHHALAAQLHEAFSAGANDDTNILHYVWVTTLPQLPGILVNTVYDLDFPTYIKNLLRGDTTGKFDKIFSSIKGGAACVPTKEHLDESVAFIASLDLNNGLTYAPSPGGPIGKNIYGGAVLPNFFQAYTATVVQIQNNV